MSGGDTCASVEPSTNSTIECTIDCGWTTASSRSQRHVEQQVRLDQLQPLVHQRRRVDGDDRAHRPRRVVQGLRRCDVGELAAVAAAERTARRGQHEPRDLARAAPAQALGQGRVLGVDRHEQVVRGRRPARRPPRPGPRRRSATPCWPAPRACRRPARPASRRRPAAPVMPLSTRSASMAASSATPSAPSRTRAVGRASRSAAAAAASARARSVTPNSSACAATVRVVGAGGQAHDLEPVRVGPHDVERLGADAARAAEQDHAPRGVTPAPRRPRRRWPVSAQGVHPVGRPDRGRQARPGAQRVAGQQLPAGRVGVAAPGVAQGDAGAAAVDLVDEAAVAPRRRFLPAHARGRVHRDDVDVRRGPPGDRGQARRVLDGVVDPADQAPLERHPAVGRVAVVLHGLLDLHRSGAGG